MPRMRLRLRVTVALSVPSLWAALTHTPATPTAAANLCSALVVVVGGWLYIGIALGITTTMMTITTMVIILIVIM